MRKVIFLLLFGIVAVAGYLLFYFNQYHIANDRGVIQSSLMEWMNHHSETIEIIVKETVHLDDTSSYIVLFQTENGNVGYAHLIRGWNGRFKIAHTGHGTNLVSYRGIETNEGTYGILVGKNPGLTINNIEVDLYYEDFNYLVDVSSEEIFVKYKHLPKHLKIPFPAELTFLDKNQSEIDISDLIKLVESN